MAEGGGFDFNQLAQRMGLGMGGSGANNDAPPKDFDELVNKILEQMVKVVSKFTGTRLDSALNTGMLANADITKAGIQVNNNIMHQGLIPDARGGSLATLAGEVFSSRVNDFSKLNPPPIEGLPVGEGQGLDMSFASLGTLTPMATGGTSASIEMNV